MIRGTGIVVLLALLPSLGPPPPTRQVGWLRSPAEVVRADIDGLQDAVVVFVMRNRRVPTLDELVQPDERGETYLRNMTEAPRDPWGTPYEIRQGDRLSQLEIQSYGPDRQAGTEDDVSSKTLQDTSARRR